MVRIVNTICASQELRSRLHGPFHPDAEAAHGRASLAGAACAAQAQDKVLNLYSARHYQTDEALYNNFTKATGIKINRIDADDAGVITRLQAEGASSPADVVLLVDAARLTKAEADGLFQPVNSAVLQSRIPANLRDASDGGGPAWFGFSTRARVIVYNKAAVQAADVDTYEELADPKNKGKVCTRSGSHPYNLTLFGSMLQHLGRGAHRGLAEGPGGQHGAAAEGWRHRPDQGRGLRRMRDRPDQQLLPGAADALDQGRGRGNDVQGGRGLPQPAKLGHPCQRGRRCRGQACQAPRRGGGLPRVPGRRRSAALFRQRQQRMAGGADGEDQRQPGAGSDGQLQGGQRLPIAQAGRNQAQVQQMLDRVGYK